jgi:hypothetical protein
VIETTSVRPDAASASALTLAHIVGLTWLAGRMYTNAAMRIGARGWFMDVFRG